MTFNLNKIGRIFNLSIDRGYWQIGRRRWTGLKWELKQYALAKATQKEKEKVCSSRQTCINWNRTYKSSCLLRQYPDPALRCAYIAFPKLSLACANRLLFATLINEGLGINSSQLGWPLGLVITFISTISWSKRLHAEVGYMFKPCHPKFFICYEACISLDVNVLKVRLWSCIIISTNIINLSACANKVYSLNAACLQHEYDHSNGELITNDLVVG